ncbi:hypothetical protein FA13DRAFT_1738043 [Coprinellus micaceus]|uniref:Uncharacterized protein n=1 Tax=Coprinellus micaceus TaxID=71717 RepID=A0A4Y7SV18_COPMI|nr:hypothetical protein FA13DRAFT_1738043 [Coprinellus micaceus]
MPSGWFLQYAGKYSQTVPRPLDHIKPACFACCRVLLQALFVCARPFEGLPDKDPRAVVAELDLVGNGVVPKATTSV